jgi:hypothetical protein
VTALGEQQTSGLRVFLDSARAATAEDMVRGFRSRSAEMLRADWCCDRRHGWVRRWSDSAVHRGALACFTQGPGCGSARGPGKGWGRGAERASVRRATSKSSGTLTRQRGLKMVAMDDDV